MIEIKPEDYTADFNGPSPRARKLADDSPFDAEDWQTGIDAIGEKWTIHAEKFARFQKTGFLRTIEAYRVIRKKGNV